MLAAIPVSAQTFQEALFLDGYTLSYRYNPAISNESGFLSVGQWENHQRNNVGAAAFLYPADDGVVTALHSSVPAGTFLGSLKDDNYFNGNINFNLFSYGWRGNGTYQTLEANIRSQYDVSVPREVFEILKNGTGKGTYDLGDLRIGGKAYLEMAWGCSWKLSDMISVGARAKLLAGVESVRYNVTRFDLSFSEEKYVADVEAEVDLTSRIGKMKVNDEGYINFLDISAKDKWKLPSGAGLALDLGILVTPVEGLTVSASVLDLGGLLWYYGNAGYSSGTTEFTGLETLTYDELQNGQLMARLNEVGNEFMKSLKIKEAKKKIKPEATPFTLNAAARYSLPMYKPLSAGVTGTLTGWQGMSYKECRFCLAWNPSERIGVTANAGVGDYGPVWGVALSAAVLKFHINAGLQSGFGGTIPYTHTPLKAQSKRLTVGLTYDL